MAKIKVYELAKELSLDSKDIIRRLQKMGFEAKSHMSTVEDKQADMIRQFASQRNENEGNTPKVTEAPRSFVPKVTRIPKAVLVQEKSADEDEAKAMDMPEKSTDQKSVAKQDIPQPSAKEEPTTTPKKEVTPAQKEQIEEPAVPVKNQETAQETKETVKQTERQAKPTIKTEEKVEPKLEEKIEKLQDSSANASDPTAPTQTPTQTQPSTSQGQQPRSDRPAAQGQRPAGQGQPYRGDRPAGQGQRPAGQGQPYRGDRPAGQGQRPAGQGQQPYRSDRPAGQGQRPAGQTQQPYRGDRPAGQGQRPAGQGQQPYRSDRPAGQGQRPAGQGQPYRSDRPAGQGQRPPGQGQPYRPAGQGQRPPGSDQAYRDKDNDKDRDRQTGPAKGRNDRPAAKGPRPAGDMPYTPSPIEKPTSTYRQEKKVFVKDIVFERNSETESQHNKDSHNYRNKHKSKYKKEAKKEMPPVVPKKVYIGESIILGELAKSMSKTAAELIKKLFQMGILATINQELDADTAILLGSEFGVTVEVKVDKTAEVMEDIDDDERLMVERPPVVTVMGHVDHGKTSLLDAIRKTNVIATEAGGITQHIGAYQVEINNRKITFLDTPGHEAFTAMRARGAQITDISILVVAADDGVMPQTVEAINHSKAAGVPIIVAINKIDKPGANPDKVKQELTEHGLLSEEWGGETIMVPVSAKSAKNIETLLEMILLVAEVAELKANPKRQARGTVVEAQLDKNRGPIATLLVQKGTLKLGDTILAGGAFGKVKAMNDDKGRKVKSAGPSMPVEVLGFSEVPFAGEVFIAVKDDKDARLVAYKQQTKKREDELHQFSKVSLEDLFSRIAEGSIKELNIILKADVQGSSEAVEQALAKLNTDEVKVNVLHSGVGGVSESDVMLASASNAIIIGFNVRPDANARRAAENENVDVRLYRVIYDAVDDIKKAMAGLLTPEFKEQIIGHAQVRAVFKVPKAGMVAGSYVTDGKITRQSSLRIIRDNIVVCESKIDSLRRFKDDAKEVLSGFECGIGIENFNDIKENDIIEAFIMEEIKREL